MEVKNSAKCFIFLICSIYFAVDLMSWSYSVAAKTTSANARLRNVSASAVAAAAAKSVMASNDKFKNVTLATGSTTTPQMQHQQPPLQPYQYVKAGRLTDEQRLMIKLFTGYDRFARPVLNMTDAITISMSLTITQIFELDEKNQVLITNAWANLEWVDQYMVWNPAEFANMEMVRMWSSKLWLPDIVLYNNAADFAPTELSTRAMVTHDGTVFWSVPTKLMSSCKIDVTFFPFDEQECRMKFGSWTYDGFKLDLTNSSTSADLSFYVRSGEWDLLSAEQRRNVVIYTCCIEPYPDVTFYIHIRRKSLYYFINIFLPCFLMSALTLLVFLLPTESGEKCGLGVTIMLSFAVFMLTVIEKLPETSESFPLISIYLTVVLSMTAVSICCTVALLTFSYKTASSAPLPTWLHRMLNCMAPMCCVHGPSQQWIKDSYPAITKITTTDFLRELTKELNNLSQGKTSDELQCPNTAYHNLILGISRIIDRHCKENEAMAANGDWRRLAQYIDRSLFWLLLTVIVFFTIYLLLYVPASNLTTIEI